MSFCYPPTLRRVFLDSAHFQRRYPLGLLVFVTLLLGATPLGSQAQPQAAVALVDPFEHVVLERQPFAAPEYILALGPMRKASGRWLPERRQRLSGSVSRYLQPLGEFYLAEEAWQDYVQQLVRKGGRLLFECSGRDCGDSNAWANQQFGIKELYGLDQYQWYAAYQLDGDEASTVVALYAVTRGNRRSYVLIDQVGLDTHELIATAPMTVAALLRKGRVYQLPGVALDGGRLQLAPRHLQSLVDALARYPSLILTIDVGGVADAQPVITDLRALLEEKGVDAARILSDTSSVHTHDVEGSGLWILISAE